MAVRIVPDKTDIILSAENSYLEPIILTITGLSGKGRLTLYVTTDPQNPILEREITANTRFGVNIRFQRQLESYFADRTSLGITIRIVDDASSVGIAALNVVLDAPPIISLPTITTDWTDGKSIIAGVTAVTAAFTVTPQLGATITEVSGSIGLEDFFSYDPQGDNAWSGRASASSITASSAILIRATDSRGKTVTYTAPLNVRDHQAPVITIEAFRCDANGDTAMNGGYLSVTAWAASNPAILGIDSLTLTVAGIETDTPINSGQTYIIGNGLIDPDTLYNVRVDAEDNYGVATYKLAELPAVVRAINVRDEVEGIAFGKLATTDGLTDSKWDINTDGNYLKNGEPVMSQINSSSSVTSTTLTVPSSSMHLVVFHGASTTKQGAAVVTCGATGTVYVQALTLGSELTLTTGTNSLTVTKATRTQVLIGDLVFRGKAMT